MANQIRPVPTVRTYGKRAFIDEGDSVKVVADGAVAVHDIAYASNFLGAVISIVDGKTGVHGKETGVKGDLVTLNIIQGTYETTQIVEGQDYAVGTPVYFDPDEKVITETETDVYAGKVVRSKEADSAIWFLLAPQHANTAKTEGE